LSLHSLADRESNHTRPLVLLCIDHYTVKLSFDSNPPTPLSFDSVYLDLGDRETQRAPAPQYKATTRYNVHPFKKVSTLRPPRPVSLSLEISPVPSICDIFCLTLRPPPLSQYWLMADLVSSAHCSTPSLHHQFLHVIPIPLASPHWPLCLT